MSDKVPDWAKALIEMLTGQRAPEVDTGGLASAVTETSAAAAEVSGWWQSESAAALVTAHAYAGPAAEQMAAGLNLRDGFRGDIANSLRGISDFVEQSGREAEFATLSMVMQAGTLLTQISSSIAMAPFTHGASAKHLPQLMKATGAQMEATRNQARQGVAEAGRRHLVPAGASSELDGFRTLGSHDPGRSTLTADPRPVVVPPSGPVHTGPEPGIANRPFANDGFANPAGPHPGSGNGGFRDDGSGNGGFGNDGPGNGSRPGGPLEPVSVQAGLAFDAALGLWAGVLPEWQTAAARQDFVDRAAEVLGRTPEGAGPEFESWYREQVARLPAQLDLERSFNEEFGVAREEFDGRVARLAEASGGLEPEWAEAERSQLRTTARSAFLTRELSSAHGLGTEEAPADRPGEAAESEPVRSARRREKAPAADEEMPETLREAELNRARDLLLEARRQRHGAAGTWPPELRSGPRDELGPYERAAHLIADELAGGRQTAAEDLAAALAAELPPDPPRLLGGSRAGTGGEPAEAARSGSPETTSSAHASAVPPRTVPDAGADTLPDVRVDAETWTRQSPGAGPSAPRGSRTDLVGDSDHPGAAPVVPEAVRRWGEARDGVLGFVHLEPLRQETLDGLRDEIAAAAAGSRLGSAADETALRSRLAERLTPELLADRMPELRSERGTDWRIVSRGREYLVHLRMRLVDPVPSDFGSDHRTESGRPELKLENRTVGFTDSIDTESGSNYRSLPLPVPASWPIVTGPLAEVRLTPTLTVTHNATSTLSSSGQRLGHMTIMRSGENSRLYELRPEWQYAVEEAPAGTTLVRAAPDALQWHEANTGGTVRVALPDHLADRAPVAPADPSDPASRPVATLDDVPLFVIDALRRPGLLLDHVRDEFGADLAGLSDGSWRAVEEFFGEKTLRANFPLRTFVSPVLLDGTGAPLGVFQVVARAGRFTPVAKSGRTLMENHVIRETTAAGAVSVSSGLDLNLQLELDGTVDTSAGHPLADDVLGGFASVRYDVAGTRTHTLGSGHDALLAHSIGSYNPHFLVSADLEYQVTLVRPGQSQHHTYETGVWSDAAFIRVHSEAMVQNDGAGSRYLPPEIRDLDYLGASVVPHRITGMEERFDRAEEWLAEHGWLPGAAGPSSATARAARLENYRRFTAARSDYGLRTGLDDAIAGGLSTWFDKPTAFGTERMELRWSAERSRAEEPVHVRSVEGLVTLSLAGVDGAGAESRSLSRTHTVGTSVGVSGPVGAVFGGDLSVARTTGTARAAHHGIVETGVLITDGAARMDVFDLPVTFRLELFPAGAEAPVERFGGPAAGRVQVWIPEHRTSSVRPGPAEQIPAATVEVVAGPARTGTGPGTFRVPDQAWVEAMAGSAELRAALGDVVAGRDPARPGRTPVETDALVPAAADAEPGLFEGARRWFSGDAARRQGLLQQTVWNALSPAALAGNAHQMLNGAHVIDLVHRGAVADDVMTVVLKAGIGEPRLLSDPGAAETPDGGFPGIFTTEFEAPDRTFHTDTVTAAGQGGLYVSASPRVADGVSLTGRLRYARGPAHTTGSTRSTATDSARTPVYGERLYSFTADVTYAMTVHRGVRNGLWNGVGAGRSAPVELRVTKQRAVQFVLDANQVRAHRDLLGREGARLADTLAALDPAPDPAPGAADPAADPDRPRDRHLPERFRAGDGMGFGTVTGIEAGRPEEYLNRIVDLVEARTPGVLTPGHSAHVPGLWSRLADHASPSGMRALSARGRSGRERLHYVYQHAGGAELVEVVLTAAPVPHRLDTVVGRDVPGNGLEGLSGHAPANTTVLESRVKGDGGSVSLAVANPTAPHGPFDDRSTVTAGLNRQRGAAQSVGRATSGGTALNTGKAAAFDVPFTFRARIGVSALPGSVVNGANRLGPFVARHTYGLAARLLGGQPAHTAELEAVVGLSFASAEAPEARHVTAPGGEDGFAPPAPIEQRLTAAVHRIAPAENPDTIVDFAGPGRETSPRRVPDPIRFRPVGDFTVHTYSAIEEVGAALGEVAPGQYTRDARLWASDDTAALQIGELLRREQVVLRDERGEFGLGSGGPHAGPGVTITATLSGLRVVGTGAVRVERSDVAGSSELSTMSQVVNPSLSVTPVIHIDPPAGAGVTAALLNDTRTHGGTAAVSAARRGILKTSSGPLGGTMELRGDLVLRVTGPAGERWVTGTVYLRALGAELLDEAAAEGPLRGPASDGEGSVRPSPGTDGEGSVAGPDPGSDSPLDLRADPRSDARLPGGDGEGGPHAEPRADDSLLGAGGEGSTDARPVMDGEPARTAVPGSGGDPAGREPADAPADPTDFADPEPVADRGTVGRSLGAEQPPAPQPHGASADRGSDRADASPAAGVREPERSGNEVPAAPEVEMWRPDPEVLTRAMPAPTAAAGQGSRVGGVRRPVRRPTGPGQAGGATAARGPSPEVRAKMRAAVVDQVRLANPAVTDRDLNAYAEYRPLFLEQLLEKADSPRDWPIEEMARLSVYPLAEASEFASLQNLPGMRAALLASSGLRVLIANEPKRMALLEDYPNVRSEIGALADFEEFRRVPPLELLATTGALPLLESDRSLRWQWEISPSLLHAFGDEPEVFAAFGDSTLTTVRAASRLPALRKAVIGAQDPREFLLRLELHGELLSAFLNRQGTVELTEQLLDSLLRRNTLLSRLSSNSPAVDVLVSIPGLLQAMADRETAEYPEIDLFSRESARLLRDVLPDLPRFAERLWRLDLLPEATENEYVADVLSSDPTAFDHVADDVLKAALRDARARTLQASAETIQRVVEIGEPLVTVLGVSDALGHILNAGQPDFEKHIEVLTRETAFVEALAAHPNTLDLLYPHHLRRLLSDGSVDLREQLVNRTGPTRPDLLRLALRRPYADNHLGLKNAHLDVTRGVEWLVHHASTIPTAVDALEESAALLAGLDQYSQNLDFGHTPAVLDLMSTDARLVALLHTRFAQSILTTPWQGGALDLAELLRRDDGALPRLVFGSPALSDVLLGERRGADLNTLARHPRMIAALADAGVELGFEHWRRILDEEQLASFLDVDGEPMARAVLAQPSLLRDLIGRWDRETSPGRITSLARTATEVWNQRLAAGPAEPGRTSDDRWLQPLRTEIAELGSPTLTDRGLPVTPARQQQLSEYFKAGADPLRPVRADRGGPADEAFDAARQIWEDHPDVRKAAEADLFLAEAMISNPGVLPALIGRPDLPGLLAADPDVMRIFGEDHAFARALVDHDLLFTTLADPNLLDTKRFLLRAPHARESYIRNENFLRMTLDDEVRYLVSVDRRLTVLAMNSPSVAGALIERSDVRDTLLRQKYLVQALTDHDEPVRRAVVASRGLFAATADLAVPDAADDPRAVAEAPRAAAETRSGFSSPSESGSESVGASGSQASAESDEPGESDPDPGTHDNALRSPAHGALTRMASVSGLAEALAAHPDLLDQKGYRRLLEDGDLHERLAGVSPALVETIASSAHLLQTAMGQPEIVSMLDAVDDPRLATALADNKIFARLLKQQPGLIEFLPKPQAEDLRIALATQPRLPVALAMQPGTVAALVRRPELARAFRANRLMVEELSAGANRGPSAVWTALRANPVLAPEMVPSLTRRLSSRPHLLAVLGTGPLGEHPADPGAAVRLRRVLFGPVGAFLDEPANSLDTVKTFLGSPDWQNRALEDPKGFVDLARRGFADLLAGAPHPQKPAVVAAPRRAQSGPAPGTESGAAPRVPAPTRRTTSAVPVPVQAAAGTGTRPEPAPAGAPAQLSEAVRHLNDAGEALDLLMGPDGGVVAEAVEQSPELLALIQARPDIAVDLDQRLTARPRPESGAAATAVAADTEARAGILREFQFRAELERVPGALPEFPRFEDAFGSHVRRLDLTLGADHQRTSDLARVTYGRVRAERAEAEGRRFGDFDPLNRGTWEPSGRIHYAGHVDARLAEEHPDLVQRLARFEGLRERQVAVNTPLHAHLGSGGLAFVYTLAPDGKVDVLFTGRSHSRQGNAYQWDGYSKGYHSGPVPLSWVSSPLLEASRRLVTSAPARARAAAEDAAAHRSGRDGFGLDGRTDELINTLIAYHRTEEHAAAPEPATAPAPAGPKQSKNKKKNKAPSAAPAGPVAHPDRVRAENALVALGVDLGHRSIQRRSEADPALGGPAAAPAAGRAERELQVGLALSDQHGGAVDRGLHEVLTTTWATDLVRAKVVAAMMTARRTSEPRSSWIRQPLSPAFARLAGPAAPSAARAFTYQRFRPEDDLRWRDSAAETAPWFDPLPTAIPAARLERERLSIQRRTPDDLWDSWAQRVFVLQADQLHSSPLIEIGTDGVIRPAKNFKPVTGVTAYDVRRYVYQAEEYRDGVSRIVEVPVVELTTRLELVPARGVTAEQVESVGRDLQAGVAAAMNGGHRLPGGEQLFVRVEIVDPANRGRQAPHGIVRVNPPGTPARQDQLPVGATLGVLTHEGGHWLGMKDVGTNPDNVVNPIDGRADEDNPSFMGPAAHGDHAVLTPADAWLMDMVRRGQTRWDAGEVVIRPDGSFEGPPLTATPRESGPDAPAAASPWLPAGARPTRAAPPSRVTRKVQNSIATFEQAVATAAPELTAQERRVLQSDTRVRVPRMRIALEAVVTAREASGAGWSDDAVEAIAHLVQLAGFDLTPDPDLLHRLIDLPGTRRAMVDSRTVAWAVKEVPESAEMLEERPNVTALLALQGRERLPDAVMDTRVAATKAVLASPELMDALEVTPELRTFWTSSPAAFVHLDGQVHLLSIAAALGGPVRTALESVPGLGEAVRKAEMPAEFLRSLNGSWELLLALDKRRAAWSQDGSELMQSLLGKPYLLKALQRNPRIVDAFIGVPGLLTPARTRTELQTIVDVLAGTPAAANGASDLFLDVITTAPVLGRRLAADLGALRAAVGNPAVAKRLSADPRAFDEFPGTAELTAALDAAVEPPPVQVSRALELQAEAAGGEVLRLAVREIPALAVALGVGGLDAEQMLGVLARTPVLIDLLRDNLTLLQDPHMFRRLLAPEPLAQALRSKMWSFSPLVAPGLLALALRHPTTAGVAFAFGGNGHAVLRIAHAFGHSEEAATAMMRSAAVVEMLGTTESSAVYAAEPGLLSSLAADSRLLPLAQPGSPLRTIVLNGFATQFREAVSDKDALLATLANRDPAVLQAIVGDGRDIGRDVAGLTTLGKLVAALVNAPSANPLSVAHWRRLLDDGELVRAFGEDTTLKTVETMLRVPGMFADLVARVPSAAAWRAGYHDLKAAAETWAPLVAKAKRGGKTPSAAWADPMRAAVAAFGEPRLTPEGLPLNPEQQARIATLIREHVEPGDASDAPAADPAVAPVLRVLKAHPEVLAAVRSTPYLSEALFSGNKDLIDALEARPQLAGVLSQNPELLRIAVGDGEFVRAVVENDDLYVLLSNPMFTEVRGSLLGDEALRTAVLGNPPLARVLLWHGADILRLGDDSVLGALVRESRVIADRVVKDGPPITSDPMTEILEGGQKKPEPLVDWLKNQPPMVAVLRRLGEGARAVVIDRHSLAEMVLPRKDGVPTENAAAVTALRALDEDPALVRGMLEGAQKTTLNEDRLLPALSDRTLMTELKQHPLASFAAGRYPEFFALAQKVPALVKAVEAAGPAGADDLAYTLHAAPVLRALITERPSFADDLAASADLRAVVTEQPTIARALRSDPGLAAQLREHPEVTSALLRHPALKDEVLAGDEGRGSRAWQAILANPWLADVVTPRLLDRLRRDESRLSEILAGGPVADHGTGPATPEARREHAERVRTVLLNRRLSAFLDGEQDPALAQRLLREPLWLERAVENPDRFQQEVRQAVQADGFPAAVRDAEPRRLLDLLDRTAEAARQPAPPVAAGASAAGRAPDRVAEAPAPRRRASVRTGDRGVPSAQVELLNAAPEALDVLLGADARDLVAELEQSPELLSLLTVPEVAEDLQFRPEALAQYRFATELDTEPERWTGRGFEAAFGSYLDTLRGLPGLRTEFSAATQNRLREAARVTWARFQSGRASTADEEHARQQRLASFNALQPGTWVMSKQIHYGGKLTEESFTPTQTQVLHRLAELAVQPQEGRFVLNVALHAHLDGGDQGVSFAYVKLPSGEVGLYPYSVSGGRSGNDYWWQHAPTGRRYVRGPLDIEAVYNEPILKESRRLVSEASAASASALTAMAGQPEEAAVALDETTRSLIQVLKDYHAPSTASLSATSVAGTSNPRGRGARRPTATGTADARAAAEVRLRQLGVDLRHRAAVWRALADDRLAGSQTVAADAAGRRRAARERDDLAAELYAAAEEGAAV